MNFVRKYNDMNLPDLPTSKHTLYLGIGGGYDIYGAIPIAESRFHTTATYVNISKEVTTMGLRYEPFYQIDPAHGAIPIAAALDVIVNDENIDTIIAVDGGVDCLMQGNEENSGTVLGDFVTLAALMNLKKQNLNLIVACVGLGCEAEEHMNYYAVMQNIARLIQNDSFYGSCSLFKNEHDPFSQYQAALKTTARKSHIQTRVLAAAEGRFGELNLLTDANLSQVLVEKPCTPTINPFMSIYWFFNFKGVAMNNRILPALQNTRTMSEALMAYRKVVTRTRPMRPFIL